jgi:Protein of unknown function (DUF1344)
MHLSAGRKFCHICPTYPSSTIAKQPKAGAHGTAGAIEKDRWGVRDMHIFLAVIISVAGLFFPFAASAESDDVEATIKNIDTAKLVLTLDDGKSYTAPEEFNFEGLKPGVKVIVFYTETDGKRVINDLEVVN